MIGIYMSGTGNTRHCIGKLMGMIEPEGEIIPIESDGAVEKIIERYPTQFSNVPFMVRDFIIRNSFIWKGKEILCMTTMGAFSGDGAGCSARLLKKYGAKIIGGLHVRMPDAVCDSRLLKKTLEENKSIVKEADRKIETVARRILDDRKYPQDLKWENRTLKQKLQKAYDFMRQFTINGRNMLERFLESIGEKVQRFVGSRR